MAGKNPPKVITAKQKAVAKLIIENASGDKPKLNGKEMLAKVGYSEGIAESPYRVIKSPGVKMALKDYGFNEETARKVVSKILVHGFKEENQLRAADQVFRVFGSYKDNSSGFQTPEAIQEVILYIRRILPEPAK